MSPYKKTLAVALPVLAALLFAGTALAWTGPAGTAPASNTAAPINTSATAQTKAGSLSITGNLTSTAVSGYGGTFTGVSGVYASSNSPGGIGLNAVGSYAGVYGTGTGTGLAAYLTTTGSIGVRLDANGETVYLSYKENASTIYSLYAPRRIYAGQQITSATAMYSPAYFYSSDERLKKNIEPLKGALAKVLSLRGVSYEWRDAARAPGVQSGFVAQEVEKIAPDLVSTDEKGIKSVDYARVTPLLVEALKAQQAQIDALAAEIQALKAR